MIFAFRLPRPQYFSGTSVKRWTENLCEARRLYYVALREHLRDPDNIPKPRRPFATRSHYTHDQVRSALTTMFGPKCAYCESHVTAVSWQNVEHFRPSSRYPALAYDWDNLLLACSRCNGEPHKSDRFPIGPSGNTPKENRTRPCARTGLGENALLLNPCIDDPDQHITFRNGRVVSLSDRGKRSVKVYGLNRSELLRARKSYLTVVRLVAEEYLIGLREGDSARQNRHGPVLYELAQRKAPFAGMVRVELANMNINWQNL